MFLPGLPQDHAQASAGRACDLYQWPSVCRLLAFSAYPVLQELPPLPSLASADPYIKRALAAMRDVRVFEADDKGTKFRQAKPLRNLPLEHPALTLTARTFASND